MWDKDTWPNNNGNTSVKLLWLFGLMERGHCWPSAGLKSITDMPSHMIWFVASGAAANTRFIYLFILVIHGRARSGVSSGSCHRAQLKNDRFDWC